MMEPVVVRRQHFDECRNAVCLLASEIHLKYLIAKNNLDDDLLLKQTNDLVISMKKNLRQRCNCVCLKELALLCNDLLWFSAGTSRLYKKLIQMLTIIEKFDKDEMVYRILLGAWTELESSVNLSHRGIDDDANSPIICSDLVMSSSYKVHSIEDNEFQQFVVWSALLDMTAAAPQIVGPYAETLVHFVSSLVRNERFEADVNKIKEDRIYTMTKLLLQSCQLIKNVGEYWQDEQIQTWIQEMKNSVSVGARAELPFLVNGSVVLVKAISASVRILCAEGLRKDCRLLAGSLISYLLSTNSDVAEIVTLSILMFCILSRSPDDDSASLSDHEDHLTIGQLFFIHGLFAYMDLKIFVHPSPPLRFLKSASIEDKSFDGVPECITSDLADRMQQPVSLTKDGEHILLKKSNELCLDQPFLMRLFDVICQFCLLPKEKFHSFRLLELWFKHLAKILSSTDSGSLSESEWSALVNPDGELVKRTLDIILVHLDNSVDGIAVHINSVIAVLIRLKSGNNSDSSLGGWLLDQACPMPWYVRARYFLMAAILEHLPLEKLLENCHQIMKEICQCLSTNYLTPSAVQVYQCILNIFSKQPNSLELFMTYCWPCILQCLASENSLMARNASHQILGITTKTISSATAEMLILIDGDSAGHTLYARLSVLSAAKRCDFEVVLPIQSLQKALQSRNNDLRLLAFDMLCVSPRSTDPLKPYEVELLKAYLPLNMNIDSPPFRKQLQADLHLLLIRARDASLSKLRQSVKRGQVATEELVLAIDFIDWLWNLCVYNLHPGGSFQRIQTALSWTRTILDTFVLRPGHTARKGVVPDDVTLLISTAEELGRCQFCSPMSTRSLISSLFNEIDEISEMSAEILLLYFPWPLNLQVRQMHLNEEVVFTACDLLTVALRLCHSSRIRDSDNGAVLIALIFEKSVIANGDYYGIDDSRYGIADGRTSDPIAEFLSLLLDQVEVGIEAASKKPLEAAMANPVQGVLCAIRRCLGGQSFHFGSSDVWTSILQRIIGLVSSLTKIILNVFGGKIASDEMTPSFEQISQAIEDAIGESSAIHDPDSTCEDTILSPEHQLMNTWCWLNIKESSLLLGQLVAAVVRPGKLFSDIILTAHDLNEVGEIFLHILTKCRHRGAIEGTCLGFSQFCSALFRSADSEMNCIPSSLLKKVFSRVDDLSASSVTRRSAGLPMIIQTILANEAKTKKTTLLNWAVAVLLNMMSRPLVDGVDDQRDLPQVHAVNIITAIVRESSIAGNMSMYLDRLTVAALKSFQSPIWAMRNASMQLFGYLLCKLVGEKKVVSDDLQTKTVTEFASHFPDLSQFAISVIRNNVKHIEDGRLISDPTLVPILSILARLSVGLNVGTGSWFMEEATGLVLALSRHWVYAVRHLSARVLTALVPYQSRSTFVRNLLARLPSSRCETESFNGLHGRLLQIKALLDFKSERTLNLAILEELLSRKWILSKENACPLVRSEFLHLVMSVFRDTQENSSSPEHISMRREIEMNIETAVTDLFPKRLRLSDAQLLGNAVWIESITSAWLTSSSKSDLVRRVTSCLTSDDLDVLNACLKWLSEESAQELVLADADIIQDYLWKILAETHPGKVVCEICEVLLRLHRNFSNLSISGDSETAYDVLIKFASEEPNGSLATLILEVSSFVIRQWTSQKEQDRARSYCSEWINQVCTCCRLEQQLNIRLSASRALEAATSGILTTASGDTKNEWSGVIARLLWTILLLLSDEDSEVREIACKTVASLSLVQPTEPTEPLHFNQAAKVFLETTIASWCRRTEFVCELYRLLIADDFVEKLSEELNNRHRRWELFPTEDQNPFLELEFLCCRVISILKAHSFSSYSDELVSWLLREAKQLKMNTERIIKVLASFESDVLLVRANRKLSAGLTMIVCLADLLRKWAADAIECSYSCLKFPTISKDLNRCIEDMGWTCNRLASFLLFGNSSNATTDQDVSTLTEFFSLNNSSCMES